jgi:hypothetical protein
VELYSIPTICLHGKVELSLCLTKHHTTKTYWEWRYSSTHPLTSALDGGEWLASRPGSFTPRERVPGTHWIGGWVGSRAGLDKVSKKNITRSRRDSNPDHLIVQPVAQSWCLIKARGQLYFYLYSLYFALNC